MDEKKKDGKVERARIICCGLQISGGGKYFAANPLIDVLKR